MSNVVNFSDSRTGAGDPPILAGLDQEDLEALLAAVQTATPEQRLTLLTLLENPTALAAVETLWTSALVSQMGRAR